MKKFRLVFLSSIALIVVGYSAWTTVEISELRARLARLETSQDALGRYAYDFGAALTSLNVPRGVPGPEMAKVVLRQMRHDESLRMAIESPRAHLISAGTPNTIRNTVERVTQ